MRAWALTAASQGDWYIYREGDDARQQGDTAMYACTKLHVDKIFYTRYEKNVYSNTNSIVVFCEISCKK